MRSVSLKSSAVGFFAIGLSLFTHSAQATTPLPNLTNLNFLLQNPGGTPTKSSFTSFDPTGWTGGNGLIYIDSSGTSNTSSSTACGPTYLQTYGCPSTLAIPGGYNEVEADGNPSFESGFNYSVSGLTVGQTYSLSFYQAASQQTTFSGATTEQWIVSLGKSGMTDNWASSGDTCNPCTYSNADSGASVVATTLMSTPSQSMTDWNYVTVDLTADATTDLLSFLAWGDGGSTANLPPMVFLAGVNSPAGLTTPEPGSVVLLVTVLFGLGLGERVRRRRVSKV